MSLRDEILEVSKDLLIESGFSGLSMRKIAKKANVTATSIYLYFKNKDDLLLTLVEQSIDSLKNELEEVWDENADPIQQIEGTANTYINFALENPKQYEIIYLVRPEIMPKYPKDKFIIVRSIFEKMAEMIRRGNNTGYFNIVDPTISAYAVWAQLHGVVSVLLNRRLDSRISSKKFTEQSINIIIQGLIGTEETIFK